MAALRVRLSLQRLPGGRLVSSAYGRDPLTQGGSVGIAGACPAQRTGDLYQVAHAHQGGEARPCCQVVAVPVDEGCGPGRTSPVPGGRMPGGDQVDLTGAVADPVPVGEDCRIGPGGDVPEQVPGPRVAVDEAPSQLPVEVIYFAL